MKRWSFVGLVLAVLAFVACWRAPEPDPPPDVNRRQSAIWMAHRWFGASVPA